MKDPDVQIEYSGIAPFVAAIVIAVAIATVFVVLILFYKNPTVECVKAGGSWKVIHLDGNSHEYCEKR